MRPMIDEYDASEVSWPFNGEDDDMLEAALRFLEDEGSSGGSDSTATVSVNPSAPLSVQVQFHCESSVAPKPRGRTKQCKRAKEQIEELREEAGELERLVKRLRSHKDTKDTVSDMWEDMLSRQLLQRHRSEVENERLRTSIKKNADLVQRLEEMIADREIHGSRTLRNSTAIISRLPSSQALDGVSEVSDVLASVTSALVPMYKQTQWVLTNPDLKTVAVASKGCRVVTKAFPGIEGPTVHLLDSRIVPFDLTTTVSAVWENLVSRLGSVRDAHDPSAEIFQTRENLLVQLPAFDGIVQNIMALRRFDESDRVVIVRSSVFTYLDNSERIVLTGLAVRHFLWTIVQKPRLTGPGFPAASQIQTLGVSIPASSPEFHASAEAITKFLGDLSLQFCESAHMDVDDRLLRGKRTLLHGV